MNDWDALPGFYTREGSADTTKFFHGDFSRTSLKLLFCAEPDGNNSIGKPALPEAPDLAEFRANPYLSE